MPVGLLPRLYRDERLRHVDVCARGFERCLLQRDA
jgi:hypothetical protein